MPYGPFGPGVVSGSNANFGMYDISGFPNSATSPAVAPLINTEIVKKSFPSMIQYLLPKGDATLFALTAKLKEETALQIEHGFFSKVMIFPSFQLTAAVASGATTALTVQSNAQVIPNGLYQVVGTVTGNSFASNGSTTGEIVLVNSVSGTAHAGSDTINVTRNVGGTSNVNLANGAYFVHIGNAFGDASSRPNSFLTQEIRVINYTQIFRNAWAISGTVAAIQNLLGDTNIAKSRIECSQYHAMDIEKSLIFGIRSHTAGSAGASGDFRTMNGLIQQISDAQATNLFLPGATSSNNVSTANSKVSGTATAGALNMDDLEAWINSCFDMAYDPMSGMERILFVGRQSHIVLNKLARFNATYFIERGETEWGLRFDRLKLTRGNVIVIEHPLFNTNPNWQTLVVAFDLPSISMAYLAGRKTKSEEYNQAGIAVDAAIDAIGGSLLTECTLLCKNPAGCGVLTNVLYAVDNAGVQH